MWEKIYAYLTFTRKERLGVLVLLVLIVLLFVFPYFFRTEPGSRDPVAYDKYKEGIREFQSAAREGAAEKNDLSESSPEQSGLYSDQTGRSSGQMHLISGKNTEYGEAEIRPALFYFDPNRLSIDEGRRLGLPDRLILTMEHYVQKGGSFRTAADLKKLYGLRKQDYERLSPYVRIREPPPGSLPEKRARSGLIWRKAREPSADDYPADAAYFKNKNFGNVPAQKSNTEENGSSADYSSKHYPYAYSAKKMEDLDINQADSSLWCRLPGIGMRLASRIIHFRDKLGGFYDIDQLGETFGLPDSTFHQIRPFLHIGSTELHKMDLNAAGQETLQAHPYIRWKLAKGIVQYRDQHGGFKSVEELQQLALMDQEKFKKLAHYVMVK